MMIALFLVMAIPFTVCSQQKSLPPGEYITEKGSGHLTIKSIKAGVAGFTIMAADDSAKRE